MAELLAADKVVGHIGGRYEFGPRALGCRSILANPGPYDNWPRINQRVKFREDFRPFAPMMLPEEAERLWGDHSKPTASPHMLLAPRTNALMGENLRAVVHKDSTSRIQTLDQETNPFLHAVLLEMKRRTGFGVLLNTRLNMSGESIISEHLDLLMFLAMSEMDAICLDGVLVEKIGNEAALNRLADQIGDRAAYLDRRPSAYRAYLARRGYDEHQPYTLAEFYRDALAEDEIPPG